MKKILNYIAKTLSVFAVVLTALFIVNATKANALNLSYGVSSGTAYPSFNNFTGVPGIVGDEHDFVRAKLESEANASYRNSVDTTCTNGARYKVWFYVHNNAQDNLNNGGTGTGIAKNVTAKVTLPSGAQTSFPISGQIQASNADTVTDGATINCGGKKFTMSYVAGSAAAYLDHTQTNIALSDSIVTTGALVGSTAADGNMWGCFGERAWIALTVEVKEVLDPATCDFLTSPTYKAKEGESVVFTASASATNASITNYIFSVNGAVVQSSASNKYTFKQAKAGSYVVSVSANVSNGSVVSSTNCTKTVTVTPAGVTTLPNTGSGETIAMFVLVVVAGTVAHAAYTKKKQN